MSYVLLTSVINLHLHQPKFKLKMPLQIFHNPLNLFAVGQSWNLFLAHPHLLATLCIFVVVIINFAVFTIIYAENNPVSTIVMWNLQKILIFHYWELNCLTKQRVLKSPSMFKFSSKRNIKSSNNIIWKYSFVRDVF